MQFIDLKSQYERVRDDLDKRVLSVLASQRYIMGPEIFELEAKLADFVGVKHAVACGSGTDALVIALMSYGLTANDAVFVPSFTFFASAEAISLAGGTPVFVDIDSSDFNISVSALEDSIEKVRAEGKLVPRGIITVDLFGRLADYDAIEEIARREGLFVLEDACQGFGASKDGKRACSFGNAAATSFFPAKPLGCYGDGGCVFTDDDSLADLFRSIRVHGGGKDKYDNVRMGINGRMDTVQAAVLLSKLTVFEDELIARQRVADYYEAGLSDVLKTPSKGAGTSAWAQYTLLADSAEQRDRILAGMKAVGVPSAVYYPIPIHRSAAYSYLGYGEGSLPVTEDFSARVFSIPMHPYLTPEVQDEIINAVRSSL